ncbi:ABC transporter substrate-binding protein [Rugamonas sp.]|uniref:substrate-binding periplasmic protein n=1 Tax=Rugamonas sp. TaxID=1926287 RepID=UPI0025D22F9F|nr:transporter substrate-binding domain-containing protein [Rugamonas sp.]
MLAEFRPATLAALSTCWLMLALAPSPARAGCTRAIVVPASALGKMIVIDKESGAVSGIYPDLLREQGRKAGCVFAFPVVPRVRAEMMLRTGQADLLLAATPVAERGQWGDYIPMVGTEWMLISRAGAPAPPTVAALAALTGVRFNAVRGFNFGARYQAMLDALEQRGELELVPDAQTVAAKMLAGRVDYSYMPSNTFAGALDALGVDGAGRGAFQYTRLDGIPASTSGVYLSKKLSPADAREVTAILLALRADDSILARARALYSPQEMSSIFPLPGAKKTGPGGRPALLSAGLAPQGGGD